MRIPEFKDFEDKRSCSGCEACVQVCNHHAILMREDEEGFRYPIVNNSLCVNCGLCLKKCQYSEEPIFNNKQHAFGGHINDSNILDQSTSGGAFSAIVNFWCDTNYVIFGAESDKLDVFHSFVTDKNNLYKYRQSKYSQSRIGNSYKDALTFLNEGKKVIFSGTPCQISALKTYIGNKNYDNLLTIEVICEGVPSPLYMRKFCKKLKSEGKILERLDYRFKDKRKWDFEVMRVKHSSKSGYKYKKIDRWFNPFWSIWLQHLMSRPSCYSCRYATPKRVADISLGDLWGVHIYCPDLYNSNRGASLIVANTTKGENIVRSILNVDFIGRELDFAQVLKFQGAMRNHININTARNEFMNDLKSGMKFDAINKKWAVTSNLKLLFKKYIFGKNSQKVFFWKLKNKFKK